MTELNPGIYEALVTEALRSRLVSLEGSFRPARRLQQAEAADRIALHLSRQIEQSLSAVAEDVRVQVGIEVAQALMARLAEFVDVETSDTPTKPGEVLHAILEQRPDGTPRPVAEPLIPLLDTTLLTNAPGEPGLANRAGGERSSHHVINAKDRR